MIGTKVRLKEECAKWYLDHPGIYFCGNKVDSDYDQEMSIWLYVCLGGKVYGEITKEGNDSWGVLLKTPFGNTFHYYSLHTDLEVL